MADLMITSGQGFEGYEVEAYKGFVYGQIALGTNFFQDLPQNLAEMNVQESTSFTNKLQQASDTAIQKLEEEAKKKGANAIIGLALNYTEFASRSVGAIASGTAVVLRRKNENLHIVSQELYITSYYKKPVPRPVQIRIKGEAKGVRLSPVFMNYKKDEIIAIKVDIELTNYYDEKLVLRGMDFTFEKGNVSKLEAVWTECNQLEEKDVKLIKEAKMHVIKYVTTRGVVLNEELPLVTPLTYARLANLKAKRGMDAMVKYHSNGSIWTCNCGCINKSGNEECELCGRKESEMNNSHMFDYEALIERMGEKKNVSEMKDVLMECIKDIDSKYRMELLETMESAIKYEKTRGDMKSYVLDRVEQIFDI